MRLSRHLSAKLEKTFRSQLRCPASQLSKGRVVIWHRKTSSNLLTDAGGGLRGKGDRFQIDIDPEADDLEFLASCLRRTVNRLPVELGGQAAVSFDSG